MIFMDLFSYKNLIFLLTVSLFIDEVKITQKVVCFRTQISCPMMYFPYSCQVISRANVGVFFHVGAHAEVRTTG